MAPPLRIHVVDGGSHVLSRGNGGGMAGDPSSAGLESAPGWLNLGWLLGDGGGGGALERREALVAYTEAPILQGRLDNPWEGLVGGVVLGEAREAEGWIRKAARGPEKARRVVVAAARRARPDWHEILSAAESIRGRS